jgi:hypothetical protein
MTRAHPHAVRSDGKDPEMSRMWGVEVRIRTVADATYVCPACGLDRDGVEIEPQRWFTVLGLPLIPLATLEPQIECGTCGHRCDVAVLDVPTSDLLGVYLDDALRHAVATIVRAGVGPGGEIDRSTHQAAINTIIADGRSYDDQQFEADLTGLDDIDTANRLRRLTDELTAHGKQSFLHRMASIAMADGVLTDRERQSLVEIGVALGMSAPHINGVIAVASALANDTPDHHRLGVAPSDAGR